PELVSVIADFLESQLTAQSFEIWIVGMRKSLGEIHAAAPAKSDFCFSGDQAFTQRSQSHRELDGRTGLGTARQCQLLVNHRQDSATRRFDGNNSPIHIAKGINRSLTYDRIFPGGDVTFGDIVHKGTGREPFVIATATAETGTPQGSASASAAG